jgi:hypothetical protein
MTVLWPDYNLGQTESVVFIMKIASFRDDVTIYTILRRWTRAKPR